jgi:hypothetical protein
VVEKLRLLQVGDVVSLLVSRLDEEKAPDHQQQPARPPSAQRVASPSQPRPLPADRVNAGPLDIAVRRERLAFDIALNDTGSAGLGVSVKGRTELTTEQDQTTKQNDCGIFIKTIMKGGAASKDRRLRENDQLIAIDGIDLLNKSNSEAMRLIGQTMQRIGPTAASIRLDVFRASTAAQENDTDWQRSAEPTGTPLSAEEGESLFLDTLRRNASRQSTTASTVPRVTVVGLSRRHYSFSQPRDFRLRRLRDCGAKSVRRSGEADDRGRSRRRVRPSVHVAPICVRQRIVRFACAQLRFQKFVRRNG